MKAKLYSIILSLIIIPSLIHGQDPFTTMDDAFQELDTNRLTLWFYNAVNAEPIPGATVLIQGIGEYRTDGEGKILFPIPEKDSTYTVYFSRDGYVKTKFGLEIMAGTIFFNRFSVSPALPVGNLRIVVDWDAKPADLDAHFVKQGHYHISYQDMWISQDGVVRLDRDDRNGHGPETITAKKIDSNVKYSYYIHDFSDRRNQNSPDLSRSKAVVKVYAANGLVNMLRIPEQQTGTVWHVFDIIDGQIRPINKISTTTAMR